MRFALVLAMVLSACPMLQMTPDASLRDSGPPHDEGEDGGLDAGRSRYDAGTSDDGFTSATAETWCESLAHASCRRAIRCLTLSANAFDRCVSREQSTCDQLAVTMGVDAGRTRFLVQPALSCLNDFATGSCVETPASCATVFAGQVSADGGCLSASECTEGTYCDVSSGRCPYRCLAFKRLNEPCDFFRRCERSLACFRADGGSSETCQPSKSADAGCTDFDECGENGTCTQGVCVKTRAGPGEACGIRGGYPFCTDEYFCRQEPAPMGMDAPPGVCQRRAGLDGTCVGTVSCLPSLRCSTPLTTGTCLAKASRGAACSAYNDCEIGLFCSSTSQRCEVFPGDGGDCSFNTGSSGRCQVGLFCQFLGTDVRVCAPRRAAGAECDYSDMCLSNECEYGLKPDGGFGGACALPCTLKADAGL